ncbi:MAG: substrate-binding domain-containing protein, partial [Synergistaceae bacterium]|nr:substrate-binding domain-containing protein [Synergistaceae bacterium]
MKKHVVIFAAAILAVSAIAAFAATDALVGACIYKFDDTFMTGVRNAMRAEMDRQGGELEIVDSQNRQPTQNDQVDAYISKGANALIVNPVDRTAAEPLMQKAKAEGLPIVFVNREPYAEVMNAYDKIWYVGAKAE